MFELFLGKNKVKFPTMWNIISSSFLNNGREKLFLTMKFIAIYIFSCPYLLKKVLFLFQIFEIDILMHLRVLRFSKSENRNFSVWCVFPCVPCKKIYVRYNNNFLSAKLKQIYVAQKHTKISWPLSYFYGSYS